MGKLILLLLLPALFGGCTNKIRVYSQFNPEYDFYADRSFSWYPSLEPIMDVPYFFDSATDQKMKEMISMKLESRGYALSQIPSSQIFHHYSVLSMTNSTTQSFPKAEPSNTPNIPPAEIQAIIILYLVNQKTNRIVWQGCTMNEIRNPVLTDPEETLSENIKLLEDLIPRIFDYFPVAPSDTK